MASSGHVFPILHTKLIDGQEGCEPARTLQLLQV